MNTDELKELDSQFSNSVTNQVHASIDQQSQNQQ